MKKVLALGFILLGADLLTKYLCTKFLSPLLYTGYPFGGIPLFEAGGVTASLNQVRNSGAAWGMMQGFPGVLAILRIASAAFLFLAKSKNVAYLLIAIGALGNGIDYFVYGQVIDFIYMTFWGYSFPVFNLADSFITIGAVLLFLLPKKKVAVFP